MSIIKSFYVDRGKDIRGDMFYIKHNSHNFTMIDCCLKASEERRESIVNEIINQSEGRICRFVSTHPHDDHIHGIDYLNEKWPIINFYAVENNRTGEDDSFKAYLKIKEEHNYAIERGIRRCWLNEKNESNEGSGVNFLWPVVENEGFKRALQNCQDDPNAISAVIEYRTGNFRIMWMGDMETEMQQVFFDAVGGELHKVDVLFLPHHGRSSANVPDELLETLDPQLIVIGAAPCEEIDYGHYDSALTLTQNTAKDFILEVSDGWIDVYTEGDINNAPGCLWNRHLGGKYNMYYQGSVKSR